MQHSDTDYDDVMDSDPSDRRSNGSCSDVDVLSQGVFTDKQQTQSCAQTCVVYWYRATAETRAKDDVKHLLQSEVRVSARLTRSVAKLLLYRNTILPNLVCYKCC